MSEKTKNLKTFSHFNPMKLRDKYSAKKVSNNYSSFWMDNDWDTRRTSIFDEEDEYVKPKTDLVALASYRRAIANFVTIVTGESDIKVKFNDGDESYTDGKEVTIGSKLDDKLFDSSVGLALHEGSHIKLSDFEFLRNLKFNIPIEYIERGSKKGFSEGEVIANIKYLLNYVEDRRIDNYIFSTSPGYKGYYHSMYNKYFYAKIIDKALLSDEHSDETMESYMFRIINLTNKNTNLNALNGLRDIWKILNIKNISRLDSSEAAFRVVLNIFDVVLNNLLDGTEKVNEETGEVTYERADGKESSEMGEGKGSGEKESREITDDEFDDLLKSIENNVMGSEGDSTESGGKSIDVDLPMSGKPSNKIDVGKETKKVELSDRQKKQLEKAIEKQKKFMEGDVPKKKVTKKDARELKTIEESGMGYVTVGKDIGWNKKGTKCLVVKKLTKDLIDMRTLDILTPYRYRHYYGRNEEVNGFVENGIRLGTILGRKLQVRGESRETKWTRKDSGKIDKRLIAELGFGNERIFNTSFIESYSDAFLHISVDASGSMSGDKWDNTMTSVVAICKAASMIQNVDVVVSIRSTHDTGGRGRRSGDKPLILIAYDSREDKFNKVKNLFSHIRVAGTTPEGLCYEAIMEEIIPSTKDRDSYFLNFSDGMPMFSNDSISYYSSDAIKHTKKMIEEIKHRDIKVLSYFIGDPDWMRDSTVSDFKTMYGKDSEFIDVTSVMAVSKTMNKKFLEKND
jgi:hypothetical protein|tara:strand:+ start:2303 stop:4519 length:2217 start_codon:yes stop_codon:yes gene_type:complete